MVGSKDWGNVVARPVSPYASHAMHLGNEA